MKTRPSFKDILNLLKINSKSKPPDSLHPIRPPNFLLFFEGTFICLRDRLTRRRDGCDNPVHLERMVNVIDGGGRDGREEGTSLPGQAVGTIHDERAGGPRASGNGRQNMRNPYYRSGPQRRGHARPLPPS